MEKKKRKSAQLEDPLGIVLGKYLPVTPFEERERGGERGERGGIVGISTLGTKLREISKSVLKIKLMV
jgi:hypothetical protein